jgi:hypothetical protein
MEWLDGHLLIWDSPKFLCIPHIRRVCGCDRTIREFRQPINIYPCTHRPMWYTSGNWASSSQCQLRGDTRRNGS